MLKQSPQPVIDDHAVTAMWFLRPEDVNSMRKYLIYS